MPGFDLTAHGRSSTATTLRRRAHLPQCRRPGRGARRCRASTRSPPSPTARSWSSTALPEHLVVVGGSYIGLEFAQMFRRFGSKVTVVEKGPRLIGARGRGRLGRDQGDPRGGGHRGPTRRRMHPLLAAHRRRRRSASTAPPARRRWPAPMSCSPSAGGPTPTISAWTRPAWRPTRAATSSSTTS